MKSKRFDHFSRLGADDCAVTAKEYHNTSINDYMLWNTYFMACDKDGEQTLKDFALENINLHYRDGYGFTSACYVDTDTDMRNNAVWTSEKPKTQMFTRFYQANPNMTRGVPQPQIETKLIQGDTVRANSYRNEPMERDFDRYIPLVPYLQENIQNPDNIVLPFHQGGENSRNFMREKQRELERQVR